MATDHFCLKWNNFHSSILSAFESLQSSEDLVDVTLMCEGRNVKAHKVILSACSPYFRNLFRETPCQHPVIILKDVLHCDLVAILQFMYQGEVLISQDGLSSFLKTAELLQVSGLAGNTPVANTQESTIIKTPPIIPLVPLPSPAPPSPTRSNKHADPAPAKPEKENKKEEKIQPRMEPDEEPIQSCSYQSPDRVIVKTESEDQDFEDMEYSLLSQDCSNSPGPGASEEQSILERSLKAQGEGKRRIAKKRSKEPSVNCPHCNIFLSRVSSLKRHYLACKMIDNPETITRKRRASMSASYALNLPKLSYHSTDANVKQLRLKTMSTNEPDPTGFPSDQLKIEKTISLRRKSIGYLSGSIDRNIDTAPDILICQPLKRRNSTNSLDFDEEKVIKDSNCSNEKPVKRTSRLSTAKKLNDEFEYY